MRHCHHKPQDSLIIVLAYREIKRLKHPLVDPGTLIYHLFPKIPEFRTFYCRALGNLLAYIISPR